jgi:glycosyltransferase involved in cell wall biosynthesis
VYVLEALDRVVASEPGLAGELEVHLVGELSDDDRSALGSAVIRTHGYLAHGEAVRLLRSADLLFLPMHDLTPGSRARIVPGKTYEYIASGRPILAAVPDGDARDLLESVGTATLCRPSDVTCMARAISEQVAARRAGRTPQPVPPAFLEEYERRTLTRRLAELFDGVVAGRVSHAQRSSDVAGDLRRAGQAA